MITHVRERLTVVVDIRSLDFCCFSKFTTP
jgi:hypothetical protein